MTTATITESWLDSPSHSFFTTTFTPTTTVTPVIAQVLFIHGFVEHVGRYTTVFNRFTDQGIKVTAFDQRGFGQTGVKANALGATSWPLALTDISFFIDHLTKSDPTLPLFLVGHSMGGGLVLGFATRKQGVAIGLDKIRGIVAAAPLILSAKEGRPSNLLVKVGSILGAVFPKLQIKTVVKPENVCRDQVVQELYRNDPLCAPIGTYKGVADMLINGAALVSTDYVNFPHTLPVLICHGEGDKVTDHDASQELAEKLKQQGVKDVEFKSYEGYYHELHNEPGELKFKPIDDWIAFVKSKL